MRTALTDIGMGNLLATLNVMELIGGTSQVLVADAAWQDIEFEVALDSGAVVHVCSLEDCPGYGLDESPGSKAGQKFLMGDGGTIPNLGQKRLNLTDEAVLGIVLIMKTVGLVVDNAFFVDQIAAQVVVVMFFKATTGGKGVIGV